MLMRLLLGVAVYWAACMSQAMAQRSALPEFNYNRRNEKAYIDSLLQAGHANLKQAERNPRSPHNDTVHLEALRYITLIHKQLRTSSRDSSYQYAQRLHDQAIRYHNKLYELHGILQQEYFLRVVRNDYINALTLNQQATALFAGLNAAEYPIWQVHMNMGDIYLLMKDYTVALRNYQLSLKKLTLYKWMSPRNKRLLTAQLTTQVGEVYEAQEHFEEALKQFETARQMAVESKSHPNEAYANERLGDFWLRRNKPTEAIRAYSRALAIWESLRDVPGQASVWARLAEAYLHTSRYEEAIQLGERAMQVGRKGHNARIQQMASLALYRAYRANGQPVRALAMHEAYVAIRDSLADRKQVEEMLVLQREFETKALRAEAERSRAEQRANIDELNRDMDRQVLLGAVLIGGLLMLLIFTGILYWRNRLIRQQRQQIEQLNIGLEDKVQRRTAELELANNQLRAKNREIEDALLKGQTLERKRVAADLHDNLGGLISAIRMSLTSLNPSRLTEREQQVYQNLLHMTKEAYAEVRHLSHNLQPEELEKKGLAYALNRLAEKLNQNLLVQFQLDATALPRLDKATEFHLYSICLELCNNILKHSGATEASIQFRRFERQLNMIVRDNGRGMETVMAAPTLAEPRVIAGMGLRNIQARTEAMQGRLEIYSEVGEGTTFFFILPLSATFAAASQETTS